MSLLGLLKADADGLAERLLREAAREAQAADIRADDPIDVVRRMRMNARRP